MYIHLSIARVPLEPFPTRTLCVSPSATGSRGGLFFFKEKVVWRIVKIVMRLYSFWSRYLATKYIAGISAAKIDSTLEFFGYRDRVEALVSYNEIYRKNRKIDTTSVTHGKGRFTKNTNHSLFVFYLSTIFLSIFKINRERLEFIGSGETIVYVKEWKIDEYRAHFLPKGK